MSRYCSYGVLMPTLDYQPKGQGGELTGPVVFSLFAGFVAAGLALLLGGWALYGIYALHEDDYGAIREEAGWRGVSAALAMALLCGFLSFRWIRGGVRKWQSPTCPYPDEEDAC